MRKVALLVFIVILVGCSSTEVEEMVNNEEAAQGATEVENPETIEAEAENSETIPSEAEYPELELVVTGPEEFVFDWSEDRCEEENIPDIAARAFRDADGLVSLTIGHLKTYRMIGSDLNNLEPDCSQPIFTSDLDSDHSMFNDGEWFGSVYTEDGETMYAIIHSEYRGHVHGENIPDLCPSGDYLACLDTALTLAISTDGGATFEDAAEAPNHLVATLPYTYEGDSIPTGLRQPSNIIKGPDGYFYVFSNIADFPRAGTPQENQRACVMRTDNLTDPKSWRYWTGAGFNGEFLDPYVDEVTSDATVCFPIDPTDLVPGLVEGIIFDKILGKYIVVGIADDPVLREPYLGVYYSVSDDLIDWSPRRLLLEVPVNATVADNTSDLYFAYPTLMDPDSESFTFDVSDGTMYLYMVRLNAGGNSLDRDLLRYPVSVAPTTFEQPAWNFDSDGDLEGWQTEFDTDEIMVADGALSLQSVGEDPILNSPPFEFPASQYSQLSITMSVSPGEPTVGQVFFLTADDKVIDEEKLITFEVIADGEFHTYDLDMAALDSWQGIIRWMRFDPVTLPDRSVVIDQIEFLE